MRIIGAETTGASDLFWYVPASSPIKSLKDTDGKTIAYSTNGSSTHGIVTAFMKQYDLKAKPTATGGPAPTLTQVMSGQIDVGWSAPPFGLQQLDEGKIRIIAQRQRRGGVQGPDGAPADHQRADAASTRKAVDRPLHEGVSRDDRLDVLRRPGGAQDLRRFRRHPGRDGQAHARRFLPARRRSIPTRSSASTRSCPTPSRSSSRPRRSRRSSSPS